MLRKKAERQGEKRKEAGVRGRRQGREARRKGESGGLGRKTVKTEQGSKERRGINVG